MELFSCKKCCLGNVKYHCVSLSKSISFSEVKPYTHSSGDIIVCKSWNEMNEKLLEARVQWLIFGDEVRNEMAKEKCQLLE